MKKGNEMGDHNGMCEMSVQTTLPQTVGYSSDVLGTGFSAKRFEDKKGDCCLLLFDDKSGHRFLIFSENEGLK